MYSQIRAWKIYLNIKKTQHGMNEKQTAWMNDINMKPLYPKKSTSTQHIFHTGNITKYIQIYINWSGRDFLSGFSFTGFHVLILSVFTKCHQLLCLGFSCRCGNLHLIWWQSVNVLQRWKSTLLAKPQKWAMKLGE